MVKIKKRSGKLEEFMKSKIVSGCKKTGATAEQAVQVAKDVSVKVAKIAVVPAKLSNMVVTSLRKINKTAADAFVRFRNKKKLKIISEMLNFQEDLLKIVFLFRISKC